MKSDSTTTTTTTTTTDRSNVEHLSWTQSLASQFPSDIYHTHSSRLLLLSARLTATLDWHQIDRGTQTWTNGRRLLYSSAWPRDELTDSSSTICATMPPFSNVLIINTLNAVQFISTAQIR